MKKHRIKKKIESKLRIRIFSFESFDFLILKFQIFSCSCQYNTKNYYMNDILGAWNNHEIIEQFFNCIIRYDKYVIIIWICIWNVEFARRKIEWWRKKRAKNEKRNEKKKVRNGYTKRMSHCVKKMQESNPINQKISGIIKLRKK